MPIMSNQANRISTSHIFLSKSQKNHVNNITVIICIVYFTLLGPTIQPRATSSPVFQEIF